MYQQYVAYRFHHINCSYFRNLMCFNFFFVHFNRFIHFNKISKSGLLLNNILFQRWWTLSPAIIFCNMQEIEILNDTQTSITITCTYKTYAFIKLFFRTPTSCGSILREKSHPRWPLIECIWILALYFGSGNEQ